MYITSLPIVGKLVTGKELKNVKLCEKYLGENLCTRSKDDGKRVVKLHVLRKKYEKILENATEEEL